jgi:5'-nucleotidase
MSAVALFAVSAPAVRAAPATVDVAVFAINDLHGNLRPPMGGIAIPDSQDPTKKIAVAAGGVEYMATLIHQLRARHKNSVFVAAGDLIGASPLLSGLFHDEPTVESLSLMGLDVSSVGNHEFDKGVTELMRMQNGGCHPVDGCKGPHPFTGAKYRYLAANVIDKTTGKPVLPPYYVKMFDGVPIAFVGLTLKGTADIVAPSGIAGVEFRDEADTINALVPQLRAQGIEAIVVLIHQGGIPSGGYNECPGIAGPIVDIVKKLDKAVDVVVSGHTHPVLCSTLRNESLS